MIAAALWVIVAVSWAYWLLALVAVVAWRSRAAPLPHGFTPPVSVLKPVKGIDPDLYENLASVCRQEYPEFEVLVGVADPSDPAAAVAARVARDFPARSVRVILAPTRIGSNPKASLLHALARKARYPVLVSADSDVRAEPIWLRDVVAPLADRRTGLVTCAYRGAAPVTLTAKLEALHMGVTFLPAAVLAHEVLGMPVALGAAVALERDVLERVGGFAAVADYVADDYQLGRRIAALGLRVRVSRAVVACVLGATTFREQWEREVRWARAMRVSRPLGYAGWGVSFSTPLALALLAATGASAGSVAAVAVSLGLRWGVAAAIARLTGDTESQRHLPLLPVRDLLGALVWAVGLAGRRVVWRGQVLELARDGRMRAAAQRAARRARDIAVRAGRSAR